MNLRPISFSELTDPVLLFFGMSIFFLVSLFILINLLRGTYHLMMKERDNEKALWGDKEDTK